MSMDDRNESIEEDRRARAVRLWLGSGALTLGMGAAMIGGAAVAAADTDSGSSDSAASSSSAGSDSSDDSSSSVKASRPGSVRSGAASVRNVRPVGADTAAVRNRSARIDKSYSTQVLIAPRERDAMSVAGQRDAAPETLALAELAPESVQKPESTSAPTVPAVVVSERDTDAAVEAGNRPALVTEQAALAPAFFAPQAARPAAFAWAPPTPNQILRTLQQFGQDMYATVAHQIRGVQRSLTVLGADLNRMLGIKRVVFIEPAPYGNPAANQQYWVQQAYRSHALATVAMAWAQLTGTQVNVQDFLDLAMDEDSLYNAGAKVYDPIANRFVSYADSYEVLQGKGVRIMTSYFARDQESHALHALTSGLQNPAKAMIVTIVGAADGINGPAGKSVIVLGVDTEAGTVIYNDPTASTGQGATMSVDDFLSAWQGSNYSLVTAQLAATAGVAPTMPAAQKTRLVWSLPRPDQLGSVLRNLGTMIAETVVNQVDGVQRNLVDLSDDLARTFGVASLIHPEPPAPGDIEYGSYAANKPFWIHQGNAQSCSIMASAGLIGQLTGVMPTKQEILEQAWSTPSDIYAGQSIFEGDGDVPGKHWGTSTVDVLKLLNLNGLDADVTTFLKSQRQLALDTLNASLADKQGVIVSVNADMVWKAHENTFFHPERYTPPNSTMRSDHMVIVLSVNTSKNVVYINDSAWETGQGLPVPLDKFLDAWQTGGHTMITAQLKAT